MAKGNLFLGQARGKVGSVVFARAFGEQITRTRPTSVANPKTIGQNTQRAILATIAKSAAVLTPLVDHSFANVAYGAESVRHFRKINMGFLRNLYLNTQNDANLSTKGGNFVPNPLKVSEGSLPSFVADVDSGDVGFVQDVNKTLPSSGDISVSRFLEVFPYLRGGDQITLVKITKVNSGELADGDALFTVSLDRMVFSPTAFDDLEATIIAEDDGVINTNFLDLTKTTDPICVSLNPATGGLGFSSDGEIYYAALILSRKVNNVWQRSTQYLTQVVFDDHTDNEAAIASYGASESLNEATEYLNQADEGDIKGGVSGAYMTASSSVNGVAGETFELDAGENASSAVAAQTGKSLQFNVNGYATGNKRIVTCDITNPAGSVVAYSYRGNVLYSKTAASGDAGAWILSCLWSDGSRSQVTLTVTVS